MPDKDFTSCARVKICSNFLVEKAVESIILFRLSTQRFLVQKIKSELHETVRSIIF